jgi:uncharacterized protein YkwD
MRKPAVVVAVAVSAVLTGGIMVTTSANAETTPDLPSPPSIVLPDMPAIPQLPDGAAVPAHPGPAVPADPGPGHQGEPADDAAPARPGGGAAPATPARPVGDDQPAATTLPAPDDEPAADDEPAEKPAVDHRPTKADEPATFAAAHRDVTVSQALSTDPHGSVQQQALDLVNEHRRRGGCDNLTVDRRLIVAANRHAADMARRGYFAHEDSHGDRAGERVEDAGYRWSRYGENIARGQDSVFEVVNGWMHSPEHRENIMDCRLHEVGVGLAFAADRTPYWVQDFATPQ